jgi:amidophosphoribosyltransferase
MGGFFGQYQSLTPFPRFLRTDYHSQIGTGEAVLAAYDEEIGLQRDIHNIENSPFRTKFEKIFDDMKGNSAIGCISDYDPQPLLIRSGLGTYAICIIGVINNAEQLINQYLDFGSGHFGAMTGGRINTAELVAAIINRKSSFAEGIKFAQDSIEHGVILILKDDGGIIAARDRLGRLPILVGKCDDGYCVSFESFAFQKLGYTMEKELGPGEAVEITVDGVKQLLRPGKEMRICAFLWTYYGYPTSTYEGSNVETMRYRNGRIMANHDNAEGNNREIDYVSGVPDSGTPLPLATKRQGNPL